MHLGLHKISNILGIQLLELMVACGVDPQQLKHQELDDSPDPKNKETDTNLTAERKVQAKIRLDSSLKSVVVTYSLVSCTGHVDATFDSGKITLPESAVGCRVSIASLTIDGKHYDISDAHPEWKTGDTLHFKSHDGTFESFDIKVEHQLSSSPHANEEVIFTVSRSDAAPSGKSKILLAAGLEGTLAPNFRIRKTEFIGLTSEGAGKFVFHMDCMKAIAAAKGVEPSCDGIDLSDIHYQLVRDDFESELTFAEADALFNSKIGNSVDAVSDFEPFKAETKQFGGFQTQTGADVLVGPDHIHDNPHMILLLQGPGPSYQYFNVDVVFTAK